MGRDKPIRVEPTPRGLGLYRRQGREGFFFIKNWSHLAKAHPGAFNNGGQFDEWIKRADGALVVSLAEAKAYCHRRNGQLETQKLALKRQFDHYNPADIDAISQKLADNWIRAWQRGVNLQKMNLQRWTIIARNLGETDAHLKCSPTIVAFTSTEEEVAAQEGPLQFVTLDILREEEGKIQRLCWDEGYRPDPKQLSVIFGHVRNQVLNHLTKAKEDQMNGHIAPPKPQMHSKGLSWGALHNAKATEGMAPGTLIGLKKALGRLEHWLSEQFRLKLPSTIDSTIALQYREWIFSEESGLLLSTSGKELRFINSAFNAAVKQGIVEANPFQHLPRDRRASIKMKIDSRKTVDTNKVMTATQVGSIHQIMLCSKNGKRDSGYRLYYLQAITGTRIQEVAGLRKCDFTKRIYKDTEYKCIEITAWRGRGLGALGGRGGLKTPQSVRIIPLPRVAETIWDELADPKSEDPAFPDEEPTGGGRWGDNLTSRMRKKIPDFPGTHAWRETMINNLLNSSVPVRIVEMITGKSSRTPLAQYTSDDLPLMAEAIRIHVELLGLPIYT
jgi:integrase